MFDEIYEKIDQLLITKKNIVVAIDGQAASGKTTLANQIKEKYQGEVIHMDDYFLRKEQRTIERLSEVSGNIDYERFEDEIVKHILDHSIEVNPFNCQRMAFDESYIIKKPSVLVIEGAYSMRLSWNHMYDLKVLVKIDSELQIKRIKNRNGEILANRFIHEWIPMENKHIKVNNLEKVADICIQISK